jgi:hypothetical protein
MFGIKKRIWTKQLKRAATIESCLVAGIFDHQLAIHGYDADNNEPSEVDGALFAGATHYMLAIDIKAQLQMLNGSPHGDEEIRSIAAQLLASDPDLERLIIRLLYEIASLAHMLEREDWAQDYLNKHPRIMDVLTPARATHPDLFRDAQETEFQILFNRFAEKYLPDMKNSTRAIFSQ